MADDEEKTVSVPVEKEASASEVSASEEADNKDQDQYDPQKSSTLYKWMVVALLALLTAIAQIATVIVAPVAPQILSDFNSHNDEYRSLIVSIWEFGEVVGPLLAGPFSELYGRAPVFHVMNLAFVVFSVCGGVSQNLSMLCAFRFLNGLSIAAVTLSPAIIGDLFAQEKRGAAISTFILMALIGTVVGPIIGSYLGESAGWRWTFWLCAIAYGVSSLLFLGLYRESYKPILDLRRQRKAEKAADGNAADDEAKPVPENASTKFRKALLRPAIMCIYSPMLVVLSLHVSVVYGLIYVVVTTIAEVFGQTYGFSEGATGLCFLGFVVGLAAGNLLCRFTLDRLIKRYASPEANELKTPERRLPPVALASIVQPIGFVMYGWTAQKHVHWMAPIVGTAIVGFGSSATTTTARSYIVDAFGNRAASAMAALLVIQNIVAAVLPLAGPALYNRVGLGWGNTIWAFILLAFLPVPLLFMRYGPRIRQRNQDRLNKALGDT